MKPILIVKLGRTFPSLVESQGDFDDWVRLRLGLPAEATAVFDVQSGDQLPDPSRFSGIVLTGSHRMVTDQDEWSQHTARWLPTVLEAAVPLLGICYGHQLLAHALGGEVGWNSRGREFGIVEVDLHPAAHDDPLFGPLPSRLAVHVCHAQSVLRLPPGATCLASNSHDPHHAFVVGKTAWGLQFHPEFDALTVKTYITLCADLLRADGADPDQLLLTATETPESNALLRRFGEICQNGQSVDCS